MKIMLHGATNGSNFGDFIFADFFYKYLEHNNLDVYFYDGPLYGIGNYFKKNIPYCKKKSFFNVFECDLLVYLPGGYFGDSNSRLIDSLKRIIRYLSVGYIFMLRRKPICIIGVGGGPINNIILRFFLKKIINYSALVMFRDVETITYFRNIGCSNDLKLSTDAAQMIRYYNFIKYHDVDRIIYNYKKIIFLHVFDDDNDNQKLKVVISKINRFMIEHQEYKIIIGCDWKNRTKIENLQIFNAIKSVNKAAYNYTSAFELAYLLSKTSLIITPKLHVGIIGSSFSKSVIAIPIHPQKVHRYYDQINEIDRVCKLNDLTPEKMEYLLNKYHNKPILLSDKQIELARSNYTFLIEFIEKMRGKV